jgi:hypothetical protein
MLENGGGRGRQCSWSRPEAKVWGPAQQIHQCGQGLAVQVPYTESGSGSTGFTCFWASWIRIHQSEVWIRIRLRIWILLSPSKKSKKNLFSSCFVTSFWLFIFEKMMYKYLQKVKSKKLEIFFVGNLGRSMTKIEGSGSESGSIS